MGMCMYTDLYIYIYLHGLHAACMLKYLPNHCLFLAAGYFRPAMNHKGREKRHTKMTSAHELGKNWGRINSLTGYRCFFFSVDTNIHLLASSVSTRLLGFLGHTHCPLLLASGWKHLGHPRPAFALNPAWRAKNRVLEDEQDMFRVSFSVTHYI
jgi:hypothetical protein